ncbi:MAG: methylmalonyl-CoA epimerase [Chloroflexi bacterium]|jgi:methylmalonyl-CoA/ethylmalonyl-CoA epimerase|nr:methylmalonyl-CoA epimerase [Chloroflexota bacterium]HIB13742.1 VOC family protein [Dehalococcoidia bacterium]
MTIPGKPPAPTGLVHHIGIAVSDLESSIEFYRGLFGLAPGPIIVREDIGVRGCFVPVGDTNLELLEGTGPNSTISIYIRERGEGLHHVCFEVDGIADKLKSLQELGIDLIDKVPRKGLMGGDIGFLDPSAARGVLIELAQHEH